MQIRVLIAAEAGCGDLFNLEFDEFFDGRQILFFRRANQRSGIHQHLDATTLEGFQRFGALLLALVAMDGVGLDALAMQIMREATGAELGADKNQYLTQLFMAQDMHQQMTFVFLSDGLQAMGDGF